MVIPLHQGLHSEVTEVQFLRFPNLNPQVKSPKQVVVYTFIKVGQANNCKAFILEERKQKDQNRMNKKCKQSRKKLFFLLN